MNRCIERCLACFIALVSLSGISPVMAQQKGQWLPGQVNLNAGIMPDPGITAVNINLDYSSSRLNDANGNAIPVTGSYSFWVVENIFYYVPRFKIFGGHFAMAIAQPTVANGDVVLDLGNPPRFPVTGGGFGFADTYVQPATLGWHLKRADLYTAYAFVAPTGRYTRDPAPISVPDIGGTNGSRGRPSTSPKIRQPA